MSALKASSWKRGLLLGAGFVAAGYGLVGVGFLVAPESNLLGGFGPLGWLFAMGGVLVLGISALAGAVACLLRGRIVQKRRRRLARAGAER